MSHVTRCPNCQTAFKVSEPQLAAHGGKVRCGKCSFVFNARACLEDTLLPEPQESPAPAAAAPVAPPVSSPIPASAKVPVNPPPAPTPPAPAAEPAPAPAAAPEPSVAEMVIAARKARMAAKAVAAQAASEQQEEARQDSTPVPAPAPAKADPRDSEALKAALKESPLTLNSVYRPIRTLEDEALLTPPEPPSRWRWLAWPLLLLLMLALLLQVGVHYRHQLATDFPWLRPPLLTACNVLGCSMPLPRNADLLRSDYSELTYLPDHDNVIQLSASVRNLAPYAQALPMLELTLTNAREEVVAKKRFTPAQYLVNSEKNRTELGPNDELHAMLQIDIGNLTSTGYTLYWFYP